MGGMRCPYRDDPGEEKTVEDEDKVIVCRCEEVTLGEIKQAVKDGAGSVGGVKKRTRACMGCARVASASPW